MARLQARESLTPQLKLEAETSKEAMGAPIVPLKKALPFAYRLQRALFITIAQILRGQSLGWPSETLRELALDSPSQGLVPNA